MTVTNLWEIYESMPAADKTANTTTLTMPLTFKDPEFSQTRPKADQRSVRLWLYNQLYTTCTHMFGTFLRTRKLRKEEICRVKKKAFQIKTGAECMLSERVTARKGSSGFGIIQAAITNICQCHANSVNRLSGCLIWVEFKRSQRGFKMHLLPFLIFRGASTEQCECEPYRTLETTKLFQIGIFGVKRHISYFSWLINAFQWTEKQIDDWLESHLGTHSAPDLLLHLFAECDCIADLCVLQRVRASLGEVRYYMVRAKLGGGRLQCT